jgi:hypothetical protein
MVSTFQESALTSLVNARLEDNSLPKVLGAKLSLATREACTGFILYERAVADSRNFTVSAPLKATNEIDWIQPLKELASEHLAMIQNDMRRCTTLEPIASGYEGRWKGSGAAEQILLYRSMDSWSY